MKVVAESHVKFIDSAERDFHAEDHAAVEETRAERAEARTKVTPPARTTGLFEAPASGPDTLPQRTSSIFEEKPSDATPTEALPGFGEILDRLSQGQRDVLQSGQPASSDASTAVPRASVSPSAEGALSGAAESEWNMDQFRRDLQNIASTLRQNEERDR